MYRFFTNFPKGRICELFSLFDSTLWENPAFIATFEIFIQDEDFSPEDDDSSAADRIYHVFYPPIIMISIRQLCAVRKEGYKMRECRILSDSDRSRSAFASEICGEYLADDIDCRGCAVSSVFHNGADDDIIIPGVGETNKPGV